MVTHQHYDQEYDFPELDPLFVIPEAAPPPVEKRNSEWTSSLTQEACTPSTASSILLTNVQSLDNKVDEIRARQSFQRYISDCNILWLTETWLS